jgi:uncharacterized protein (DUF3820 family)
VRQASHLRGPYKALHKACGAPLSHLPRQPKPSLGNPKSNLSELEIMTVEVVPFGKYKGKLLSRMLENRQYCRWLLEQGWFKEQYGDIYNAVVAEIEQAPKDTPEHNQLQIRFLDDAFVKSFIKMVINHELCEYISHEMQFEHKMFFRTGRTGGHWGNPIDVFLTVKIKYKDQNVWPQEDDLRWPIEVKTFVGDDYPEILRQINNAVPPIPSIQTRNPITKFLFIESYSGSISVEQLRGFFAASKIHVIFLNDILELG